MNLKHPKNFYYMYMKNKEIENNFYTKQTKTN